MNRFIQTHYSSKQPENYHQYKEHPYLSIEAALAAVVSDRNQLEYFVKLAKSSCRNFPAYELTKDESAAIYLYMKDWGEQSLHHQLNQALTSEMYSLIRPWFGFLKLFITALEKLPSRNTTIWRGLKSDIAGVLQENAEITWWTFSSCSLSHTFISDLLDRNSALCSIEAINAKIVRDFVYHTTEDEVLLLPGTRLRVKSKRIDRPTGKLIIYFEEISNDIFKIAASTTTSVSATSKAPNHDPRAYRLRDPLFTGKDESKDDKVFSATDFANGDRYEVAYKDGKKHSYGVLFCSNGSMCEGQLADSRAYGKGKRTWGNGDRYDGNFRHGMMYGSGEYIRADGYVYVGEWIADEPYGKGTSNWSNGNRYKGDHVRGKIEGRGVFVSSNGDKYDGDLVDGKAHGQGVRTWPNGDRYDGDFRDDKKHGYGTYSYANGGKYVGGWADDEMNGEGFLQWSSGSSYQGTFKNGKRHGLGKLTFANGKVQNGRWDNDNYTD